VSVGQRYRAILTGASGGLGRAIAVALAPQCDSLLLVGRHRERLDAAAREAGPVASTLVADLSTPEGRDAIAAYPLQPNLLINSAGASDFGWLAGQDDRMLERIMGMNVLAPMQLVRRLLPRLERERQAWIVNVGSIFGYLGYPGQAAYSASKFALRGFSEALGRELADGPVRVLYFAPRSARTSMNDASMVALNAELGVAMDEPAEVAAALLALLRRPARERLLGMPEKLFARINQIAPRLVDFALRRQLPAIRRHLPASSEGASR